MCGDGLTNATAGEDCDDGGESDACDIDCTMAECGDGQVNGAAGELCDDQGISATCDADCTEAICGDGVVNETAGEACDDEGPSPNCTADCALTPCGDGIVDVANGEECDDQGESATCDTDCTLVACADGVTNLAAGETCDDANVDETDGCLSTCETALSCAFIHAEFPALPTGIYWIDPDGAAANAPQQVLCDMVTDEGGWTLVASTLDATLNDEASAYYADLTTINPAAAHSGVWDGMRPLVPANSDIRFTCIQFVPANVFSVDLSFYDIVWYREISTGTDAESCFSEQNGDFDDQPTPARRNNISGITLPVNDQWTAGFLEGEDSCGDENDFTVDFDDRGMDGNQSDGTDWGEDDSFFKCGLSGLDEGAWHIWVRET
jgi:hypothetical protein